MGIKNMFKTKPPSEAEVDSKIKMKMSERGMPTKGNTKMPNTFAAYSNFANDKTKQKVYAPKGYEQYAENNRGEKVYAQNDANNDDPNGNPVNQQKNSGGNPYGSMSSNNSQNPYGSMDSYNNQSSYGGSARSGNSYGGGSGNSPYSGMNSNQSSSGYGSSRNNGYGGQQDKGRNQGYGGSYGGPQNSRPQPGTAANEDDLNYVPDDRPGYRGGSQQGQNFSQEDDLNADVVRDDYDYQGGYQGEHELTEEELAQKQEDEEVENIKGQIRFTKQESVASTRNTLRMAREAEESGQNTIGMLGAQSEVLYNVKRNMELAETQDRMAKTKVSELHHYNRSIFKPGMQNPFTKSRRLKQQEATLKNDRIKSKAESEQSRKELMTSTTKIKACLNDQGSMADNVGDRYRREKNLEQAKRYQFENDSEDDDMENEIGQNLDEISKISGRLKKLAMTQRDEVDKHNVAIRDLEEKADRLDVNVYMNTASLSKTR